MRYFIELSYNGKAYHGWQNQPNAISVQEVIETALSVILKEKIAIMGAGRTDTGVHAKQMFAHFDFDGEFDTEKLLYRLNSYLPKDVALHRIFKVIPDAHARFHAESRTYLYRIALQKNVFNFNEAYWVKPILNIKNMIEAANVLLDYKDFQCFSKTNTDVKTYNCNIMAVNLEVVENELQFTITADRFLRNMVRAIVGTLINVGLGKLDTDDIHRIISSKNRSEAGYSVPPQGLYLTHIIYPESIVL
ncbi:tRNA pseudouridine(38-40) synthase TruA [Formosa sp. PL04]|uniref:tRNA pseudouridine(38-40) synthase TruA n=1 Tax=Formosa sp. PL04 TaxID=3081755 RepID=UPI002980E860|nr:tRNA pseudouridine(38-40) synthase TruA [Formosa sp. PL04]MDW5290424.1 tRNA pseudouridine(38-40) synthase TruA [Formosa sp. PL04]